MVWILLRMIILITSASFFDRMEASEIEFGTCGGSLITSLNEPGCHIGACSCIPFFGECNSEKVCNAETNECLGRCDLSLYGSILLYGISFLMIAVPLGVLIRRMIRLARTQKAREEETGENDMDDIDTEALNAVVQLDVYQQLGLSLPLARLGSRRYSGWSSTSSPEPSRRKLTTPSSPLATVSIDKSLCTTTNGKISPEEPLQVDLEHQLTREESQAENDYIDVEMMVKENSLGYTGIESTPEIYLETVSKATHKSFVTYLFTIIAVSLTMSIYEAELPDQEWKIPFSSRPCIDESTTASVFERQCTSTSDNLRNVTAFGHVDVSDIKRFTNLIRIELDLQNVSVSRGFKQGVNKIAYYSISLESFDEHDDEENQAIEIVKDFNGLLVADCACRRPTNCQELDCGIVSLLSIRQRRLQGSYDYGLRSLRYAVTYSSLLSNIKSEEEPLRFDTYYVRAFTPFMAWAQECVLALIASLNTLLFIWYVAKVVRMNESLTHQRLERQLSLVMLLCQVIQSNLIEYILTLVWSISLGYDRFERIWDTFAFGIVFSSVWMILDSYQATIAQKNGEKLGLALVLPETSESQENPEENLKNPFWGTTAIMQKVLKHITGWTIMALSVRTTLIALNEIQFLVVIDIFLLFIGASLVFRVATNLYVNVLKDQRYTKTRLEQLSYRVLTLVTYALLALVLVSILFENPFQRISRYQPSTERATYLSAVFACSFLTYGITLAFGPVTESNTASNNFGYVFREERQFLMTPKSKTKRHAGARWKMVRQIVTRELVPYWKPHSIFCLETASRMYNCSRFAYYDPVDATPGPFGPINTLALSANGFEIVTMIQHQDTDTNCLVLRGQHRIVFAFRGTASKKNVKTDIAIQFVPYEDNGGCYVHAGFSSSYATIAGELHQVLKSILAEDEDESDIDAWQIYTTGHSLGGALATLAALDITKAFARQVIMYNFGSPRVGCPNFQEYYDTQVPLSFRVVNEGDVVCGQPTSALPLIPGCKRKYRHIGTEVTLDGRLNGDMLVDPSFFEKNVYFEFQRKPTRHLMHSYKNSFDQIIKRILSEGSDGFVNPNDDRIDSPTISPRSLFLRTRNTETHWSDTMRRISSKLSLEKSSMKLLSSEERSNSSKSLIFSTTDPRDRELSDMSSKSQSQKFTNVYF